MQQRRLRLGDILDDYCPRERRITNHAVVAMIEDEIKQTRCTTCETEHEYKQAKLPTLRRKKDSVAKAYKEVLAGVTADATMQAAQAAAADEPESPEEDQLALPIAPPVDAPPDAPASPIEALPDAPTVDAQAPTGDVAEQENQENAEGRVHRRLIRATLPRPENQPVARPIPQFTMRQPQGRPGKFRAGGGGRGPSAGRGAAQGRSGGHANSSSRGAGFRGGAGRAQGRNDFRPQRAGQPARHGKKFSK
jgi:hypothetical protein